MEEGLTYLNLGSGIRPLFQTETIESIKFDKSNMEYNGVKAMDVPQVSTRKKFDMSR